MILGIREGAAVLITNSSKIMFLRTALKKKKYFKFYVYADFGYGTINTKSIS